MYATIAFSAIIVVWGLYWYLVSSILCDYTTRGQFGDMFGAINALFTGLAFAGLIVTIIQQSKELRIQSTELFNQSGALKISSQQFVEQNNTLKRQQFETMLFNVVAILNQQLNNSRLTASGKEYSGREIFDVIKGEVARFIGDWKYTQPEHYSDFRIRYYHAYNLYGYFLTPYVSNVLMVLQVVDSSDFIDHEKKLNYIRLFFSMLSDFEKTFLFYHIPLSVKKNNNTDAKLYYIYKKYQIGDNLNDPWFEKTHIVFKNFDIESNPGAKYYTTD